MYQKMIRCNLNINTQNFFKNDSAFFEIISILAVQCAVLLSHGSMFVDSVSKLKNVCFISENISIKVHGTYIPHQFFDYIISQLWEKDKYWGCAQRTCNRYYVKKIQLKIQLSHWTQKKMKEKNKPKTTDLIKDRTHNCVQSNAFTGNVIRIPHIMELHFHYLKRKKLHLLKKRKKKVTEQNSHLCLSTLKLVAGGFLRVLRFPPLLHRLVNGSANKINLK